MAGAQLLSSCNEAACIEQEFEEQSHLLDVIRAVYFHSAEPCFQLLPRASQGGRIRQRIQRETKNHGKQGRKIRP